MSSKHTTLMVSPRMAKALKRKVVSMIVKRRSAEYRASLERQIEAGKPICIPLELREELLALNAKYVKKRATPQV